VGAVAVVEGGVLRGIFSERDVIKKVVYTGGAPEQTSVAAVMTTEVESIAADTPAPEALQLMVDGHFRHLPIVDSEGKVLGILSIRNFLQNRVEELEDSINSITSYYGADGSGG
jgi:CBS domain-containing protein